jgi:hypothetical protein
MVSGIEYASINQFLTIFTWFPLAALMSVLMLIARFYQKQSGQNTHYPWFLVPIMLYGAAAARASNVDLAFGDPLAAVLMFCGGIALATLCLILFRQMTLGR